MSNQAKHFYEFGPFRLDTAERLLLHNGCPVPLTPKAYEMLLALVERSGHVVGKEELLKEVWPEQFVEEGNLSQHVFALRRALGESREEMQYIETVPRRGYRFVAEVRELAPADSSVVIIERHAIARVVTEEKEETPDSEGSLNSVPPATAVEVRPARRTSLFDSSPRLRRLVSAALTLLLIAAVAWALYPNWWGEAQSRFNAPAPTTIRSLAVLPFRPLARGAEDEEALRVGMADSLITRLSHLSGILVRPTSAILKYADAEQDPIAAGRELRVEAVLDGRIQREGDRIRVTVQLIRLADARTLWAGQFEEPATGVFAAQDSISRQVVEALAVSLNDNERLRLQKTYTNNPEAYRAYLMGRYFWNKRTPEGLNKAIEEFNRALELDPSYALAYVGLADAYVLRGAYDNLTAEEASRLARVAIEKALALDSTLGEAHASLGFARFMGDWDWAGAEREYRRAIELNPNHATAYHWHAINLMVMGRAEESLAAIRRALEIDPLSIPINTEYGVLLYFARRYDEALAQYHKLRQMEPDRASIENGIAGIYMTKGLIREALTHFENYKNSYPNEPHAIASLGHAYAITGNRDAALRMLAELEALAKRKYVPAYNVAFIHAGLGDHDRALAWLEKAYQERFIVLTWVKVDPIFDPLRSDPRFIDLLRRLNLAA